MCKELNLRELVNVLDTDDYFLHELFLHYFADNLECSS